MPPRLGMEIQQDKNAGVMIPLEVETDHGNEEYVYELFSLLLH